MKRRGDPVELEGFAAWLDELMRKDQVPGIAVGVIRGGDVVYAKGFGSRNIERELPVTPQTLFPIGSNTKAFTAMAVGMLVDEGSLDWDTPIIEYLPDFRLRDEYATMHATPRDLLCHRTGLPRYDVFAFFPPPDRETSYRRLRHLEPSAGFREFFQYSNLMYVVAGILVERLSGMPWERFVADRIFRPLHMEHSNLGVARLRESPDFAEPYADAGGTVTKIPFRDMDWAGPAGSVNSSAAEMARWLRLHLGGGEIDGNRLITRQSLAQMQMPQMAVNGNKDPVCSTGEAVAYGMGWMISDHRGQRMLKHGGNIDGFAAQMSVLPDAGLGVVVLTNKALTVLADTATCELYDRLLGLEARDWYGHHRELMAALHGACGGAAAPGKAAEGSGSPPSLALDEYRGSYEHPAFGRVVIATAGTGLEGGFPGHGEPLEHVRFDVFRFDGGVLKGLPVRFHLDEGGAVRSLSVRLESGVPEAVFERVREPAAAPSPGAAGVS